MIDESQESEWVREELAGSPLLDGLDEGQLAAFMTLVSVVELTDPGVFIVREGDDAENFYMILDGEADVIKRDPDDGKEFELGTVGPGDHFGETALSHEAKRTASIRAATPMTLVMLKTREIRAAPNSHPWLAIFLLNLAREAAARLDRLSGDTLVGMRAKIDGGERGVVLNRFLTFAISSLSLYAVTLSFLLRAVTNDVVGGLISNGLFLGMGALLIWMMTKSNYPLRFFGVRLALDWRAELRETLLITGVVLALLTGIKFILIHVVWSLRGFELFTPRDLGVVEFMVVLGLGLFMVLQEVCVRGALQSSLAEVFAEDPRRIMYSVLLSNALFGALHSHLSPYLAILVFVPGVMWGLLYARHRSLLGVSISHVLIGLWALRLLGITELVRML